MRLDLPRILHIVTHQNHKMSKNLMKVKSLEKKQEILSRQTLGYNRNRLVRQKSPLLIARITDLILKKACSNITIIASLLACNRPSHRVQPCIWPQLSLTTGNSVTSNSKSLQTNHGRNLTSRWPILSLAIKNKSSSSLSKAGRCTGRIIRLKAMALQTILRPLCRQQFRYLMMEL